MVLWEEEGRLSTVAVIAIVVAAILLVAILVALTRRTTARHARSHDDTYPYRSHAEASRDRDEDAE